ncbi:hypothetical protein DY000_02026889 [Brassica cretica]|uniref:Uncharacterized protein n=1 Tax=Brassica cretica TaxID=69181 RepID=A0ABQ7EFN2_BRACR|nr:hypothetical protein DY000_02026889 [Brassica cretica]
MDSAAPPGSPVSPTRDKEVTEVRDEGSTEGTNEEVAQVNEEVIVEKCVEADTQKKENPVGDKRVVTSDESSNWALVSPAKMGRSPVKANQTEVLHISASKFSVLSVEEEHEEGEIYTIKAESLMGFCP